MLRRGLEETKDRHEGRTVSGKERDIPERRRERTPPRRIYNDTEYKVIVASLHIFCLDTKTSAVS